ncbi:MAG TPA: SGNH/GDSL hydrolase family protein, partial [Thermoleophilaceae bacterium]|nr:SGNH/GDSL hydrolase family protein [Thermoleophilaceae bacterium]
MRVGAVAVVVALLGAAAPAAAAPSQVLYVGDSLGVGTTPGLARELASSARVRGDSRIGRPSGEGLRLLERMLSPADDIVVFDLGTNDDPAQPGVLARDLAAARTTTGDRCLIVATLNRPPLNGVSVDRLNQAVRSFANGAHDVQLVDWNALATQEPSLLAADRVHATPAGYAVRSQLFAEAVGACADQAPESGARPAPAPRRPKKRRPRKPAREVEVPGIESSGISFTEPVAFESRGATLTGKLLLPDGKPPYPAVVMLPGSGRQEAEALASDGIAALTYDRGGGDRRYEALAADARAA